MTIFRVIFLFIFTPIRLLANFLTKRNDNVLEWHLNYGALFIKIQTNYKDKFLSDDLLIAGYILFLARYFYICDDRQADVVRSFLLNSLNRFNKINRITSKLFYEVFETLTRMERNAVYSLFETPPMVFSENDEPKHSFAKYNFFVFERAGGNGLGHIFHMSAGPDIILLPITVGILYDYVVNKLLDKNKKEKLNSAITYLLKKHSVVDSRSKIGQNELPNEVISHFNINLKS